MSNTEKPVGNDGSTVSSQSTSAEDASGPEYRTGAGIEVPNAPHGNGKTDKKEKNTHELLRTGLTAGALIVAIYAAYMSAGSRDAARESARAARKSAEATQQNAAIAKQTFIPKMRVLGITKGSEILPDSRIPLNFLWRNEGGSDALRIYAEAKAGICVGQRDMSCLQIEPFPTPPPEESRGQGDIYAKEAGFSTVSLPPQSQEVIKAFGRGDQTIYVYGVFHYKDSFETRYECEFCYFYMLDQEGALMRCPTYNQCKEHQPNSSS